MELKTFVAETLTQILNGIREAQRLPGGEDVGAAGYFGSDPSITNSGSDVFFTPVKFDISVAAETKDGGGSVRVAEIELSDGGSTTSQHANRVQFTVHIRLPKGGDRRGSSPRSGTAITDFDVFGND